MKDKGRKLLDGALERLRVALEWGHSEQLTAYLRAMRHFRQYSVGNVLLIAMQHAEATHVAGFHTWRRVGRWVRQGETGIRILAPVVRRASKDDDDEEDRAVAFRTVCVFDVSQTDGAPLPEPAQVTGDPGAALARLHAFAAAKGIRVEHADAGLGSAQGASLGGRIVLKEGLSPAIELSVLAHELAHELLHKHDRTIDRRIRELEAEAVAFAVCEAVGVDSTLQSSDYIQCYGAKGKNLLASLTRIQDAATQLVAAVEGGDEAVAEGGAGHLATKAAA